MDDPQNEAERSCEGLINKTETSKEFLKDCPEGTLSCFSAKGLMVTVSQDPDLSKCVTLTR